MEVHDSFHSRRGGESRRRRKMAQPHHRLQPGQELILALNATVEGQTTAHYIADRVAGTGVRLSRLAQGVPIGGELDYLDDGTLTAALNARRAL